MYVFFQNSQMFINYLPKNNDLDNRSYFINMLDMKNGKLLILGDWLSFFSYGKFDGQDLKLHFWKKDEKK